MFPERVAMGASRLTVRNAAVLLSILEDDAECGFSSPQVRDHPTLAGDAGSDGSATWTVRECRIHLGLDPREVGRDCGGKATRAGGTIIASATRTVRGTLTGNRANPVVPADADAVAIAVDARFDRYQVRMEGDPTGLTVEYGRLTFEASPRLAVSASKGLCAVPTNEVSLSHLRWEDAGLTVDDGSNVFTVEVAKSDCDAQVGRGPSRENALSGSIQVWGNDVAIPTADDRGGLDPHYDAEAYARTWDCKDDLAKPVTHQCPSLETVVGQGAARLTMRLFGSLADVLDRDATCGFASSGVLAGAKLTGTVGDAGGQAVLATTGPCLLRFPPRAVVHEDCAGVKTYLEGTALVTGKKTLSGILSGDPKEPVVPTGRDPAVVELAITFQNLSVSDSASTHVLAVESGALSGTLFPRVAVDTTTGACSMKTPVASFRGLAWKDGRLAVSSDGNTIKLRVDESRLDAQNGAKDGVENALSGTLTANGKPVPIPAQLDPEYQAAAFLKSFTCDANLRLPASDADCDLTPMLAENAARLVVQTAGGAARMVNNDSHCGFENLWVKLGPVDVQGDPGTMGLMKWHVDGCRVGSDAPATQAQDCLGGVDVSDGHATVSATRTVTGEREKLLGLFDSIIPRSRTAVTIALDSVDLAGFAAYKVEAGAAAPRGILRFAAGSLTATVTPILGERKSSPGRFDIPTPLAMLDSVVLQGADAMLEARGKKFHLKLPEARLTAMNGHWQGRGNSLAGTIRVGTRSFPLALPLDPDYDQGSFDQGYACTKDLRGLVPP